MSIGIGPRLELRQGLQLVMTPQLQQAIKLLTLTNLELESYIGEELERNPLLETGERDAVEPTDSGDADRAADGSDGDFEPATADELIARGDGVADAPLDVDYAAETFHHDSASDAGLGQPAERAGSEAPQAGGGEGGDFAPDFETMAAADPSLAEVLLEQALGSFAGAELLIARHIIDQIDEAGYLQESVGLIAERLDADPAVVERVLGQIQRFEPVGVGARTLSECLKVQAREANRLDPAMEALLDNLPLVARGDMAALRRLCGVDAEDLADMIRELRTYNPKPGLRFGGERPTPVVPDIFVFRAKNGGWGVELNAATLPRVLVDRTYYAELARAADRNGAKAAKAYLHDCLTSANWLVKALDQRARTIVKVATELVKQQEAFFDQGVHHLRPLTLRRIAEEIGMHESTVSRVTSHKYLSCERGLFELKYFFTSAIQTSGDGEAVSGQVVKDRIARLIAAETGETILSDDKLVEVLNAEGFDIARRTVAKYRESLGLGSSVQRRRAKLLAV